MNSLYLSCGLLAGSIKQDNNLHKPIMAIIPNSALVLIADFCQGQTF